MLERITLRIIFVLLVALVPAVLGQEPRKAYIDGVAYSLEAMQASILLALMDDFDHRMEGSVLRDACGSDAERFAPIKFFGRNQLVYKTFIKYIFGDKEYALTIPDGDRDWLH